MSGRSARAVFVDRDGVVCALCADPATGELEAPLDVADVTLLAGAPEAVRALHAAGYLVVGVTNQPAAAKGRISRKDQDEIHATVVRLLRAAGAVLDEWRVCPHHPDGTVAGLSGPCACRKPAPGMLLDAAASLDIDLARSWIVGDSATDIAAGAAAGVHTVLVGGPGPKHGGCAPDLVADDLAGAAAAILDRDA